MASEQKKVYEWKVTGTDLIQRMKSAKNGESFDSDLFRFNKAKWYIKCCPDGQKKGSSGYVGLFLYLAFMPSQWGKVSVKMQLRFIEENKTCNRQYKYEMNGTKGAGFHKLCAQNQLLTHDTFTFEVTIELIQLYDINGKEIEGETEYKVENINNVSENDISLMNVRINSLETRINEIFKMVKKLRNKAENDEKNDGNILNDMKNMKQEMRLLKQTINQNDNKVILSKKDKLKKWLTDEVELPLYYDIFIENGIEDLQVAKMITIDTLKEMQITKIGHRMKIMQNVAVLNANVAVLNANVAMNNNMEGMGKIIDTNQ
eukprot:235507_1